MSAAVQTATAAATIGWQPPASWRSGAVANAATLPDSTEGYLQRIESRLTALEQTLAQRSLSAEECAELRKAIGIGQQDASFALVKARQILEKIVRRLYRRHRPTLPQKALLFEMIRDLTGQANRPAVLPRRIGHYLETIRVLGNLEVLLERASPPDTCMIDITTAAHGFGAVWDAVVRDFVARQPAHDGQCHRVVFAGARAVGCVAVNAA